MIYRVEFTLPGFSCNIVKYLDAADILQAIEIVAEQHRKARIVKVEQFGPVQNVRQQ